MSEFSLIFIIVSLVLGIISFFWWRFEWQVVLGIVFFGVVISIAIPSMYVGEMTRDTEILNGKVISKEQKKVSCEHSYSCNCKTVCSGSGQNRSCSRRCDTCYEHSHDYDWNVHTTVGEIRISRIDKQGKKEPPRFSSVVVGEPASAPNDFVNYIKGAPNSLFNRDAPRKYSTPAYPVVYDYYRVNRVIDPDNVIADDVLLNDTLNKALTALGPMYRVNLIVVFTKTTDEAYFHDLKTAWLGGKKNDVVVVVSSDGQTNNWVRVFSWSKSSLFDIELQDALHDVKPGVDMAKPIEDTIKKLFDKKSMQEYNYLEDEVDFEWFVYVITMFLVVLPYVGVAFIKKRSFK